MLARFRDYYRQLSLREQLLLVLAAVILVAVGGYIGVVQPLIDRRTAATAELAGRRELHAWMVEAAARARQLGPAVSGAAMTMEAATPAAIEQSLRGRGLSAMVVRLEPTPEGIDIDLRGAPLDATVAWIAEAERALGYGLDEADLVRAEAAGTADVRLRLAPRGQP